MHATRLAIPDVILLEPKVFGDDRGFFMETLQPARLRDRHRLAPTSCRTTIHARSEACCAACTTRSSSRRAKLVRVARGEVLRRGRRPAPHSPSFGPLGRCSTLSEDNHNGSCWRPQGFAHGFLVLRDVRTYSTRPPTTTAAERALHGVERPGDRMATGRLQPLLSARTSAACHWPTATPSTKSQPRIAQLPQRAMSRPRGSARSGPSSSAPRRSPAPSPLPPARRTHSPPAIWSGV